VKIQILFLRRLVHMNNTKTDIYYMECDGAVKIPKKYDKMNLSEITAECARLSKEKTSQKTVAKKEKAKCKTKFAI
jgi:hypothetical protein